MIGVITRAPLPRALAGYLLLVGVPAALALWLVNIGRVSGLPLVTSTAVAAPSSPPFSVGLLLAQLVIILIVAWAAGHVARRFGQPAVVGEMAAGLLLGPSFFGAVAASSHAALFPAPSLGWLSALSQLGLVLFLFLVGLETNLRRIAGEANTAIMASHTSIAVPFVLGVALALPLSARFGVPGIPFAHFALFLGAAMSVTAFPVLARILEERKMLGTSLGTLAMSCAAVDDVTAWLLLAAVTALVRGSDTGPAQLAFTVVATTTFAWLLLSVGRRLFAPLAQRVRQHGLVRGDAALIVIIALGSAWATDALGVHPLFGAFLAGVAMPKDEQFVAAV